jgi:endoglucanase
MVESPAAPWSIHYSNEAGAINTDLQGLNALQVLDRIVEYAGALGLKIILDNHRSEAGDGAEANGLWYTEAYPESAWIADWQKLATRYRDNSTVIGMDLRNEPHGLSQGGGACWDCGGRVDWHLAAERAGDAVLAINPRLIVLVEGTDGYDGDLYWWGGNLEGVRLSPVRLAVAHQLVYSPHEYGPNEYKQKWFGPETTSFSLETTWMKHWGYLSRDGIAPVWLGEFGTSNRRDDLTGDVAGSQGQWFESLVAFLGRNPQLGWTAWALNGEDVNGLLAPDYGNTPASELKMRLLTKIETPELSPKPLNHSVVELGSQTSSGQPKYRPTHFGPGSGAVN